MRTIDQILASVSDILFPAECGDALVTLDSRDSDDDSPLHVLCWRNDFEGVRVLIDAGADVNAIGDMGETPLHVAISQNNVALATLLMDSGARSDITSEFSVTPREKALRTGGAIADLFIVRGT